MRVLSHAIIDDTRTIANGESWAVGVWSNLTQFSSQVPDGATVIGKPFSIDELRDTVRDLVGRSDASLR